VNPASLLLQLLNGLAGASSLFLLAAGLTLIFGVTRIVNFAHGSLMMLGAYIAWSVSAALGADGFWLGVVTAALAVAALGALVERTLLRRLYGAPELLQLLATFALVLIIADATLALWGAEDRLGPRAPGFRGALSIAGGVLPAYDALLIALGPLALLALWWLLARTRFGVRVRAASENPAMAAALGIDPKPLFTTVFALGSGLAGLAGALQLPREPATLGMDLSSIADAFVVVVVGGLGSITGAFVAALAISLAKSLCIALGTVPLAGYAIAFPKLTPVAEFVLMALVLAVRPQGLFGRTGATPAPHLVATRLRPAISLALPAAAAVAVAVAVVAGGYWRVLAGDVLLLALFAASLRLLLGPGGMISFGHACYFGVGAYALGIAIRHGAGTLTALVAVLPATLAVALVFGWLCVRLSGVYMAMLTLALAQIAWAVAMQWEDVTGGSNGLVGLWPQGLLAEPAWFFALVVIASVAGMAKLAWIEATPFGFTLRGVRDAPARAAAIGIDTRLTQWAAFVIAGVFAGVAGALHALSKGSISPEILAIPHSVDALVVVLIGGAQWVAGPLLGAAVLAGLQDTLARSVDYWRALLGALILLMALAFPGGIGGIGGFHRRARPGSATP
jgi:branched-chain amino acid transport system permease protein